MFISDLLINYSTTATDGFKEITNMKMVEFSKRSSFISLQIIKQVKLFPEVEKNVILFFNNTKLLFER